MAELDNFNVQSPQVESMAASRARQLTLRNAMLQGQAEQIDLRQKQQAYADDQQTRQIYKDAYGQPAAASAGAAPVQAPPTLAGTMAPTPTQMSGQPAPGTPGGAPGVPLAAPPPQAQPDPSLTGPGVGAGWASLTPVGSPPAQSGPVPQSSGTMAAAAPPVQAPPTLGGTVRTPGFDPMGTAQKLMAAGLIPQGQALIANANKNRDDAAMALKNESEGKNFQQTTANSQYANIRDAMQEVIKIGEDNPNDPSVGEKAFYDAQNNLLRTGQMQPSQASAWEGMPALKGHFATIDGQVKRDDAAAKEQATKQAKAMAPSELANSQAVAVKAGVEAKQMVDLGMPLYQNMSLAEQKRNNEILRNQGAQRLAIERNNSDVARAAADPWGALGLNKHPMGGGANGATNGAALTGDDFLRTLPPQMAATVKAVAEGRQTNLPRGGKELDQLMGAVNQYDPTYSVQRAQQRTAFTTGKQGTNIGNLNTAVVHMDRYHEAMKALNNGSFVPGNEAYNYLVGKFGSTAVTNPDFVRQSLAGEAASALKGNATDPEIAHMLDALGKNQSSEQQEGTALEALRVMGDKMNTYDEQYHQVSPGDPWSPVLPTAQAVFKRYGINPLARNGGGDTPAKSPASAYKVGDTVNYNGVAHKVTGITSAGKLQLSQ